MPNSTSVPSRAEVVVVGAGLAGLAAAARLAGEGSDVVVLDASDGVGGRIRTDEVEGFQLDRGFQVLLTAYEEVAEQVDLDRLDVRAFRPGSLIRTRGGFERLGDPMRDPGSAVASLRARVGTLADKLRVARLRHRLLSAPAADCFTGPERSTLAELQALGFSDDFIDRFFRPFLGGVFLERALETSASLFRYYFRCFAKGDAVLPARGMQRLPEVLSEPVRDRIFLNTKVDAVSASGVTLADGTFIKAGRVIVAVDGAAASRLLGTRAPGFKSTVTAYFAAERAPVDDPVLILDGDGTGPVNHVAVLSAVAPEYAPPGAHLISVSGVDAAADDVAAFRQAAPTQLRRWFGSEVDAWRHLRTYRIPHALPRHPAHSLMPVTSPGRVIVAGDYLEFGSIQGALLSGRRAADSVLIDQTIPTPIRRTS